MLGGRPGASVAARAAQSGGWQLLTAVQKKLKDRLTRILRLCGAGPICEAMQLGEVLMAAVLKVAGLAHALRPVLPSLMARLPLLPVPSEDGSGYGRPYPGRLMAVYGSSFISRSLASWCLLAPCWLDQTCLQAGAQTEADLSLRQLV